MDDNLTIKEKSRSEGLVISILFAIIFTIGSDTFLISPLVPTLSTTFRISDSKAALFVSAYSISYALFAFIFGPLSDKIGRVTMLRWGLLSFAVLTGLCSLAWNFESMFTFRLLSGMAAAATSPQVWAYVGDSIPFERRGRAMGIISAALSVGQIVGVPIATFIAAKFQWHGSFIALGSLALLVFFLVIFLFPKNKKISTDVQQKNTVFMLLSSLGSVLKNARALLGLFVTFFMMFASFGMYSFLGAWLSNTYHLPLGMIGTVIICVGMGNLIGNLIGGHLADKFGKQRVVLTGLSIMAVALFILPFTSFALPLSLVAIFIWLASGGSSLASLNSILSELMPTLRGTMMSLNNSFMYLGTTIGVAIDSIALNSLGYGSLGIISCFAALVAVAILVFLIKAPAKDELV